MNAFRDSLLWYNNKNVVPILEPVQNMISFYHDKDVDMLKLGCLLPNLANICLQKSTDAKFCPFMEAGKDLLEKSRKDVVGGPSIVFYVNQSWMKLSFGNRRTYANLLSGLILASYTPTRCVNPCRPVFVHVANSIQKPAGSHLDKTRHTALIICSSPIFNE